MTKIFCPRRFQSWRALAMARAMALAIVLLAAAPALSWADQDRQTREAIQILINASKARAAIIKGVAPAVVHISVEKLVESNGQKDQPVPDFFKDEFFRRFFGPRMPNPREFRQRGLGSGSIVDKRGYILTNNHVIAGADRIVVKIQDGQEYEAKLIGADPKTDLAVLKIEAKNLAVVRLGNSDKLDVGETVIAIGNPFGLEQTVTQGIVSAKKRSSVGLTDYEDFIQTDASINPGNSGGPLINLSGEVIGVNTAIFSRSGGSMGIGFSIPINMARQVMDALIKHGKVVRGYLGVVIQDIDKELAEALGVRPREGVLIANVGPESPADKAGIKQQDIVTHFNGRAVKTSNELRNAVAGIQPGNKVPVKLLRNGKSMVVRVTIGEQPENMRAAIEGQGSPPSLDSPGGGGGRPETSLGMTLENLTPALARRLGYRNRGGVIISQVAPNGPAADKGLRRGSLIERVNSKKIRNVQNFRTQVNKVKKGESILMLVRFRQTTRFVVLKKP